MHASRFATRAGVAVEPRIVDELFAADGPAQALVEVLVPGRDEDVAVAGREHLVGHHLVVGGAEASRLGAVLEEVRHLVAHHAHGGVPRREVSALPPCPVASRREEGGHRCEGGHRPRREVEEGGPAANRSAAGVAGDRHDPAVGLDEGLVARVLRLGAAPTEGGDGGVDELRIERRDVVVARARTVPCPQS